MPHSEHPPPWVVELDRGLASKKETFLLQKSARTFSQGRNNEPTCPELENRKKFAETQMNGREVRFSSYRLVKLWKRLKSFPSLTLSSGKFGMGWRGIDSGASGFRRYWSSGSIPISPEQPREGAGVRAAGCNALAHQHAQGRPASSGPQSPSQCHARSVAQSAWSQSPRYRGRFLHGMAPRPAVADYPCWNLSLAYLRIPHCYSNMPPFSSKQKNYYARNIVSLL